MLNTNLDLIPPFRWAIIEEGIFRGAYPNLRNFRFLRRLQLKVIVSVIPEKPTTDLREFCNNENIRLIHFKAEKYKEESVSLSHEQISEILAVLTDTRNHPLYIHCLDGAGVTGHIIMCLRKLQHWHRVSYVAEFNRLARENASSEEKQFVEEYKEITLPHSDYIPTWLWGGIPVTRHPTIRISYHHHQAQNPSSIQHQSPYHRPKILKSSMVETLSEEGAFLNRSFSTGGPISKWKNSDQSLEHFPSPTSSSSSLHTSSNQKQSLASSTSYTSFFKEGSKSSTPQDSNICMRMNRREMIALHLEGNESLQGKSNASFLDEHRSSLKNIPTVRRRSSSYGQYPFEMEDLSSLLPEQPTKKRKSSYSSSSQRDFK